MTNAKSMSKSQCRMDPDRYFVADADFLNSDFIRHSSLVIRIFVTSSRPGLSLRQNLSHDSPVNIGQPKIPAGVPVSELFVVKAEQMQKRRVQIVNVNFVFDRLESEFIGGAVNRAAFDAAAGQPYTEAVRIVIAPHLRFA